MQVGRLPNSEPLRWSVGESLGGVATCCRGSNPAHAYSCKHFWRGIGVVFDNGLPKPLTYGKIICHFRILYEKSILLQGSTARTCRAFVVRLRPAFLFLPSRAMSWLYADVWGNGELYIHIYIYIHMYLCM